MCGRYILTAPPEAVAKAFGYRDAAWFPPRYNIAPSQPVAVVRFVRRTRELALVRWGLIPGWAKDPRRFTLLVNARAEGLAGKAAFRGPVQYRRCLVPATGYYQWRRDGTGRSEPWLVRRRDGGLMGFAGLWEAWIGERRQRDRHRVHRHHTGEPRAGLSRRADAGNHSSGTLG